MKNIIFPVLALLLTAFFSNIQAQSRMTEEQKEEARKRYEDYRAKLNLTEEQSEKVKTINMQFFEGLAPLRNSTESRMSKYKKFKALKDTKDKQMKEALTADQFKTYQEFQGEMKEEFKENRRKQ